MVEKRTALNFKIKKTVHYLLLTQLRYYLSPFSSPQALFSQNFGDEAQYNQYISITCDRTAL